MGQAAVDLPDTPNPSPTSAASTDDLLAQMAGEEIDRLLAEADGERPAKPAPVPAAPAPADTPAQKRSNAAAEASAAVESPDADASQLDGVLGGIATDIGPDPVAELAGASRGTARGASDDGHRPDPLEEEEAAAIAERGALSDAARNHSDAAASAASVPVLVRVLSWLNSPMASCPEHVREAIGKIAILTAVNSISVFAYVLFFRHHR
jgi:hypothetical protein